MKLALARAMLLEAGLLLLDEPTNHMDTANVAWLTNYLTTCGITLIVVSHDSGFLDAVCTGIIHYENKKLVKYRGNLSAFVAQRPEAKAYYELTDEFVKFTFPVPGPLDGVKCAASSPVSLSFPNMSYMLHV
jgi:elongation factor 3